MYDASRPTLHGSLAAVDRIMGQIDRYAHRAATSLLSDVTADMILGAYETLADAKANLQAVVDAAPAGLVQFARDQSDNPNIDPVAEFTAVKGEIDAFLTEVEATIPVSGGYLALQTLAGGQVTWRTFTPSQTAALKVRMDSIKDMITS